MPSEPRVFAVAQARMGSTRLPGKVLMDLGDHPIVEWVMVRAAKAKLAGVVLAIPDLPEDDVLDQLAQERGWRLHRGSAEDVQERYLGAAAAVQADHVVRLTCDNPFVDRELIDAIVRGHLRSGSDYSAYHLAHPFPLGLSVEVVSIDALKRARAMAGEPHEREHVTSGVYTRRGEFRVHHEDPPEGFRHADLRMTIDTQEDMAAMRQLVSLAGPDPVAVRARRYVELLSSHPEIRAMNAHVRQKRLGE